MSETSMPYDVSAWAFDPMNPGPGFSLEPGVGDEELWYRSHFGMHGLDQAQWQPVAETAAGYEFASPAAGKMSYEHLPSFPTDTFPSRSGKLLARFDNLQATNGAPPYSLDDLLRTASQLATERALYMNIPPPNPQSPPAHHISSPVADPCISSPSASPSHHSNTSDDEHDPPAADFAQVYRLPEGSGNNTNGYFSPPVHQFQSHDHVATTVASAQSKAHSERKSSLTPLEMPDGTTRFTANWLPVDPQGGFTIRPPALHSMDLDPDMMTDYHSHFHQDHGYNNYNHRHAFISLENSEAGTEAGV
ncbi:hypothetical protein BDW59DRAFT_99536 [Aspergillus cavernicola]|uniref:Uncharacterized protein n=1 Tax=Aspergillus cavernicola TaxID=176166 RepID=A0ABR4I6E0_9EURO